MRSMSLDSLLTYYALSQATPEASMGFSCACLMEGFGQDKKNAR